MAQPSMEVARREIRELAGSCFDTTDGDGDGEEDGEEEYWGSGAVAVYGGSGVYDKSMADTSRYTASIVIRNSDSDNKSDGRADKNGKVITEVDSAYANRANVTEINNQVVNAPSTSFSTSFFYTTYNSSTIHKTLAHLQPLLGLPQIAQLEIKLNVKNQANYTTKCSHRRKFLQSQFPLFTHIFVTSVW
jgi:hypothetical protein